MQLHPLKQLVHIETGFSVVEPDHEAECDEVGLERIHEAAAERVGRKRPAEGVDDHVERPLGLPDLLHAERENLGILGAHALAIEPRLRERPPRALSQYRDLRDEVVRRHVVGERPAIAVETARRRANPCHALLVHEQARRWEPGEHVHAQRRGALPEPPHDLAQ